MAELKTRPTGEDVNTFIAGIEDETKREDSRALVEILRRLTGEEPRMWGTAIVGFGDYHYRSSSGREGDWFKVGFSPRKQSLSLYLVGYVDQHQDLLSKLGKHTTGKGCIYVKRLADIDQKVLEKLIKRALAQL